jgi:outer membrane protein assembly factor BamE (lipoprotein component of BamABCDE complex)
MWVKKVSTIFIMLLVVGLSAVILSGCRIGGPTNEAKETIVEEEQEQTPVATLEKYNQLDKGMTYEEATDIMGFTGKPMSDESSDSNHKTYVWDGKQSKSFLTVTFLKGKLSTKQQVGLK